MTEDAVFELLSLDCRVDAYGTVYYYNALGQRHRVYGPAIEYYTGRRDWYQNGRLHRLDGPAIEYSDGSRVWYQHGQRHRVDGPAVDRTDGYRAWYQNGLRHRLDGPAIERPDGSRDWYIDGEELTESEWQQVVASMETVWQIL